MNRSRFVDFHAQFVFFNHKQHSSYLFHWLMEFEGRIWLCRQLVTSLLPWRIRFDPRLVHVEFVVDEVVVGQVFLSVLKVYLSVSFP
jgi:hypothetical protein